MGETTRSETPNAIPIEDAGPRIPAPDLPYKPQDPREYHPGIGLVGCGGISAEHLKAYRKAGYRVLAVCDTRIERARERQQEFFPHADVYEDYRRLLERTDIEVLDIATHPADRGAIIEAALRAGKHVLSQKPFVLDLDYGQQLVDLADRQKVQLAVNQNGRWAPHFSYIRQALAAGILGELATIHSRVHWDHSWVGGTPFEQIKDLILYDFAIHWYDFVNCLLGDRPVLRVFASVARSPGQTIMPALLGQALIELPTGQCSLAFDGQTRFGANDTTIVTGTLGTILSTGPSIRRQWLTLYTADGHAQPKLEGVWFPDGFHGTMGELLCAIEEGREATHHARHNLKSLALCFAALGSAVRHVPVVPGEVRRVGD